MKEKRNKTTKRIGPKTWWLVAAVLAFTQGMPQIGLAGAPVAKVMTVSTGVQETTGQNISSLKPIDPIVAKSTIRAIESGSLAEAAAREKKDTSTPIAKTQTTEEERREVADAAYASLAVYMGEEGKLAWRYLEYEGYTLKLFKVDQNRLLWAHKEENGQPIQLLAIAGTESKFGLKVDLKTDTVPFLERSEYQVHQGFYELAKMIVDDPLVHQIVHKAKQTPDGKLVMVGHSLGGSVSLISGLLLEDTGVIDPKQLNVVTFGAPMIGNQQMAEYTAKVNYRAHELENDLIPKSLQIIHDRYMGYLPNRIKWQTYSPDTSLFHSIIRYIDEAERQRSAGYTDDVYEPDEKKFYLSAPLIEDRVGLKEPLLMAYQKGLLHSVYEPIKKQAKVTYKTESVTSSLQRAAQEGYRYLVVIEVTFEKEWDSRVDNYYMKLTKSIYDVATKRPVKQGFRVITDGGYSLLANSIMKNGQDFHSALFDFM